MPKKRKNKPKVYVALLSMGSVIYGLESSLVQWMRERSGKYQFQFFIKKSIPTDSNRNRITYEFLHGDWDYLAMFDEDNYPLKNPFDLLDFDKDVIGGIYPGWGKDGLRFHVYRKEYAEKDNPESITYKQYAPIEREGLKRVDAIGTGCIFIKRKVLETIKTPFSYIYNEFGALKFSDDMAFCKRCDEAGFEIYAHWDFPVEHYKTVPLLQVAGLVARAAKTGEVRLSNDVLKLKKNEIRGNKNKSRSSKAKGNGQD